MAEYTDREAICVENGRVVAYEIKDNEWWFENFCLHCGPGWTERRKTMNNCVCKTKKQKNIYRLLCVIFAVIDCLLLCFICVIIKKETNPTVIVDGPSTYKSMEFEEQPEVENDILCYDPFTGYVYSCFERSDGNVQLRINPEGNYCISLFIERNDFYEMQIQKQTRGTDSDGIDTADSSIHADCNGDLSW